MSASMSRPCVEDVVCGLFVGSGSWAARVSAVARSCEFSGVEAAGSDCAAVDDNASDGPTVELDAMAAVGTAVVAAGPGWSCVCQFPRAFEDTYTCLASRSFESPTNGG